MSLGVMTLLQLRTAAQQRADMVNSEFVSDSEWNSYINQSYYELYDLLVQKYGNDYYVADPHTFTTDGVNDSYALPSDFYKLLGVDLQLGISQDSWVTLKPFNFAERNRYAVPNLQSFYGLTNMRYRLRGMLKLWLTPFPAGGQNLRLWYVPRLTELSDDTSEADGVSGWTEYIICDAAMKALQKEESDVSVLMAEKQALIARIEAAAENRDPGSPQTVADTQTASDMDGWPGGGGGWGGY